MSVNGTTSRGIKWQKLVWSKKVLNETQFVLNRMSAHVGVSYRWQQLTWQHCCDSLNEQNSLHGTCPSRRKSRLEVDSSREHLTLVARSDCFGKSSLSIALERYHLQHCPLTPLEVKDPRANILSASCSAGLIPFPSSSHSLLIRKIFNTKPSDCVCILKAFLETGGWLGEDVSSSDGGELTSALYYALSPVSRVSDACVRLFSHDTRKSLPLWQGDEWREFFFLCARLEFPDSKMNTKVFHA